MDRLIYHNDKIVDVADARISPTVGGLLYGWGVFTTLRVYAGCAFAFEQHWERLLRHAEKARVAVSLEAEEVKAALDQLIAANSLVEGRARLNFLKGSAGSWRVEEGRETEFLIFTSSVQPPARSELAITVSPIRILSTGPLAGVKCTATLENLLALEEARSRGFDEAVMLNERGEIAATTAANIFWVQGDEIFTPSPATGCVAGVTRRMVCEIAAKWKLHVVEGGFPVQRLLDAREVFLTSTAREVAFVSGFDIKEYSRKQARVTKLISRQFQNLIAGDKINP